VNRTVKKSKSKLRHAWSLALNTQQSTSQKLPAKWLVTHAER